MKYSESSRITSGANEGRLELFRALADAAIARGGVNADLDTLHPAAVDFVHQISVRTIAEEWLRSHGAAATEYPINEALTRSLTGRGSSRGLGGDDFL
ncbi:MAG: hypothetical protein E4H01_08530, partial [Lysobacterales bacterium]